MAVGGAVTGDFTETVPNPSNTVIENAVMSSYFNVFLFDIP